MSVEIIAEAATNHNGDMELAKEMIWAAKESGADYIKFQSLRLLTEIIHNWGNTNQGCNLDMHTWPGF